MAANATVPNSFTDGTATSAPAVNANFTAILNWVNTNAVHLDGTKAFTAVPSGPATDPTTANQLTRKAYVDAKVWATANYADASVTTSKIVDGNITTVKIADANVTTPKIADANVTNPKLASDAVTWDKFATGTRPMRIVTSSTRPSSPAAGDLIYETDKKRLRIYNGSLWELMSGAMGCAYTGTGTVVANGASGNFTHDVEVEDTDSFGAAGSATITVPELGVYAITADFSATAGDPIAGLGTLLAVTAGGRVWDFRWSQPVNQTISFTVPLASGATIVFSTTNGTGASYTITHAVWVRRVSAA